MTTAAVENSAPAKTSPLSDGLTSMVQAAFAETTDPYYAAQPKQEDSSDTKPDVKEQLAPQPDKVAATSDAKADKPDEKPAEPKPEVKPEEDHTKKHLREQRAANARLGNELKAATEEIKILKAKLDGTYQEPSEPSPEDKAKIDEFRGKEQVSRKMANEQYGEQTVNEAIYDDGSPYQTLIASEPWHHIRVSRSEHPVQEAYRVLQEQKVYQDLGPDPTKWEQAITDRIRPKLHEEWKKQQADTSALVGKPVPGVDEARGAGGSREAVKADTEFTLAFLGGHFAD